jgi:predicted DNA-binding transcriptional regulator AlpA
MALLKAADVARLLNVRPSSVYSFIGRGMPHIRLSPRCIRFEEKDVTAWIEQCRTVNTPFVEQRSPLLPLSKGDREYTAFVNKRPKKNATR